MSDAARDTGCAPLSASYQLKIQKQEINMRIDSLRYALTPRQRSVVAALLQHSSSEKHTTSRSSMAQLNSAALAAASPEIMLTVLTLHYMYVSHLCSN